MPKLIFRGTTIRFVDLRYDEKSKTVYTKVNFTAAWSEPVRDAMEWADSPHGYGAADLDGELVATNLEMIPNGELKHHAFDLEAREISSFSVHPKKDDDGNVVDRELRFQIVTTAPKAGQKLAAYLGTIGKGEAQLKVTYDAQSTLENEADDKQQSLEGTETEPASDGPTLMPTGKRHGARPKADKVN